jgi:hypothetical protein
MMRNPNSAVLHLWRPTAEQQAAIRAAGPSLRGNTNPKLMAFAHSRGCVPALK